MNTNTTTVTNANPFQMFAQYKVNELPPAIVTMMNRSKLGKQALEFAKANNGSFDGFIPPTTETAQRKQVPAGFRYCRDCEREALAKGYTQDDADAAATQAEENFAKAGKKENGKIRYTSYCKPHNNARAAKYADLVKEKQRIRQIVNEYLPKAEQRVNVLKAELEFLQAKYPNFKVTDTEEAEMVEEADFGSEAIDVVA